MHKEIDDKIFTIYIVMSKILLLMYLLKKKATKTKKEKNVDFGIKPITINDNLLGDQLAYINIMILVGLIVLFCPLKATAVLYDLVRLETIPSVVSTLL